MPAEKKPTRAGKILAFLVIGLLIFFGVRMCNNSKWAQQERIYYTAKEIVKDHLKSPTSAEFSGKCEVLVSPDSIYFVKSWVDSKNPLGTMMRNNFIVAMKYKGGTMSDRNNWAVIDVRLEGR